MRDYEFGNHLAELRKSHGYSQFQLGSLVGVTDKAVSKWENGASRPRVGIVMKLSGILGVDMNELLMEVHDQFPKEGENLIALKCSIWEKAESKMRSIYGDSPHLLVRNRFLMEKNALGSSDVIVMLDTLSLLADFARDEGSYITSRGLTNCCFVAWLLGATNINPLPAHYLCPICHEIVFQPETKCGWDLPDRQCNHCGSNLLKDGHDLPFEICVCGSQDQLLSISCGISDNLANKAYEMVVNHLNPYYSFKRHSKTVISEGVKNNAFTLFMTPISGKESERPGNVLEMNDDAFWNHLSNVPSLAVIPFFQKQPLQKQANVIARLSDLLQPSVMECALQECTDEMRKSFEMLAEKDEAHTADIDRFPPRIPKADSFSKMVDILCGLSGTYSLPNCEALAISLGIDDFTSLPLSREDVWHLIFKCADQSGQISGIASEIVFKLRKGIYNRSLSEDDRILFRQLNLPPWFEDYAQRIQYLFPRCHNVSVAFNYLLEYECKAFANKTQPEA